ncbi:MAG: hypothetical protein M1833_007320 [Piccolia ochrophora]|nr:MAG: hypothetical protein M1833_007320 [Piccolia ochrophora]
MAPHSQFNTKSPTIKRILREASELSSSPSPDYHAAPLDTNLFEWHFTLRGPPNTPYAAGLYHGRIILPPTYPLRPPSFRFLTPSGRFESNREICLSISGHHEETWQPAWGVRTALVALRAFMSGEARGQVGGLECSTSARERMAKESGAWRCAGGCGGRSNREIIDEVEREAEGMDRKSDEAADAVPDELRLAYRDELGQKEGSSEEEKASRPAKDTPLVNTSTPSSQPPTASPSTAAPAPTTPRPTRTIAVQRPLPPSSQRSNDGAPAWIDRAIGGVAACLALMITKKVLGF